ncbi:MAG: addiction module protein [Planctomycetaceae bacterium]
MSNFDTLLTEASHLGVADRLQLIEALWDSIPAHLLPPLSSEWQAEIQRRSARFDAGQSETVSWEQVKADSIKRLGQ